MRCWYSKDRVEIMSDLNDIMSLIYIFETLFIKS